MRQIPILVAILLTISLILLIGISGSGLNVDVFPDGHYSPYSLGHVSIALKNGWWARSINLEKIDLKIENINAFKWEISNYTSSLPAGGSTSILANVTIQEWTSGTFNYSLTLTYTQSTMLWFGSAQTQQVVNGTINIG